MRHVPVVVKVKKERVRGVDVYVTHQLLRVGRAGWIERDILSKKPQSTSFLDTFEEAQEEWKKVPGIEMDP
jgi:hypothetical protein